jgi:osmotically-inducible protein OsmY
MKIQNEHLEHFVSQKLLRDPDFSSANIDVIANDGKVQLVGKVGSFRRKLRAVQLAATCDGVSSVENLLEVDSKYRENDRKIAELVSDNLLLDPAIRQQVIRVDVRDGAVTLSGYVADDAEKRIAEDVAMGVRGVRQVENMLMVNATKVIANDEHCNTIRASLSRVIGLPDSELKVCVIDETAQISGRVNEIWQKEVAEATVRKFGILNVCNDICVK